MNYHYFASSVAEWKVDKDLPKLIRAMKKDDFPFVVWIVPVNIEGDYEINFFAPIVDGAIMIYQHGFDSDKLSPYLRQRAKASLARH